MRVGRNPIPSWVGALVMGGWMATVLTWERRRGLRAVRESKLRRDVRNLSVASLAGVVIQLLETPVAFTLAQRAGQQKRGLVQWLPLPRFARGLVAIALLDYTFYLWHVMTHRLPVLWRFHQVHHMDREMDATTALRFHFGEMAISVPYRALQVLLIGPTAMTVALWQMFMFACILFHHSNACLPLRWERRIARLLITPRLHGIHHSVAGAEVNSNWSSGLTVWDWLHGTLRTRVPQAGITIGVPELRADSDLVIGNLLPLPFREAGRVPEVQHGTVREPLAALAE